MPESNTTEKRTLSSFGKPFLAATLLLSSLTVNSTFAEPKITPRHERLWQDEIVYVVIPGKFFNGDPSNDFMLHKYGDDREKYEGGFWGGDLCGIIKKLDYIRSLGVTTILLYPVVQNDRGLFGRFLATGYRPKDYFRVDENFGSLEDLRELVRRAHAKDLRVILDLPLALPGIEHPLYTRENMEQGWFGEITPYGVPHWKAEHPVVAQYLLDVSVYWRDATDCDGFRLDSAHHFSNEFLRRYSKEMRSAPGKEDFILVGEVARHPREIGEFLSTTDFTSAYDFSFTTCQDVLGTGEKDFHALSFVFAHAHEFYPFPERLFGSIDNYETPEFISIAAEPKKDRMKQALLLQFTIDRVPLVYSGDEIALSYKNVGELFQKKNDDPEFREFFRTLTALRQREPALRRGDFDLIHSTDDLLAFTRRHEDQQILVVLNRSSESQHFKVPAAGRDGKQTNLLTSSETSGLSSSLDIGPHGFVVLKLAHSITGNSVTRSMVHP